MPVVTGKNTPEYLANADTCVACGGQLAYLVTAGKPTVVACVVCHRPVLANHPLQVEIDEAWKAREAKERESARRRSASPPPKSEYEESQPLAALADDLNATKLALGKIAGSLEALGKELRAFGQRLAALEVAQKKAK